MTNLVVRQWLITTGSSVAAAALGIASGIIVARSLDPAARGELAQIMIPAALLSNLALFGLPATATQLAATTTNERDLERRCLQVAAVTVSIGTITGLSVLLTRRNPSELAALYVVILIPSHVISMTLLSIDAGRLRVGRNSVFRMLQVAGYFIALLLLTTAGKVSANAVLLAHCLSVSAVALARLTVRAPHSSSPDTEKIKTSVWARAVAFFMPSLAQLAQSEADKLVGLALFVPEVLGLYVVALTFARAPIALASSGFSALLLPRVARAAAGPDRARMVARFFRLSLLGNLLVAALAIAAMPVALPLTVGHQYSGAVHLAQILALSGVFFAMRSIVEFALNGAGDWRGMMSSYLVEIAIFALAVLPLSRFGAVGIAGAATLSSFFGLMYSLLAVRRRLGVQLRWVWPLNRATFADAYSLATLAIKLILGGKPHRAS